jgi:aminoglycoside/choline kinase family phosphotransferase
MSAHENQLMKKRDQASWQAIHLIGIPYYMGIFNTNPIPGRLMSLISNSLSAAAPVGANPDARLTLLQTWLAGLDLVQTDSTRPASSDASFRRYFRVDVLPASQSALGATLIAMDAPPLQEDVQPFIKVAQLFAASGVAVPTVVAQHIEHGFLLLSDMGNTTYLSRLNVETAGTMYGAAIESLLNIQQHGEAGVLPDYDRATLLRELNLFPEWYIGQHMGKTLTPAQSAQLNSVFDVLLANNLSQQQVHVHRDFHSRNLMVMEGGGPGILDFQDALYGPITYDLVSLLRDAYVQWDEEMVLDWVVRYWQKAKQLGLPVNPDIDAFYRDFEFMGMQRHLKILGIFARLNYRDGKPMYMNDLPMVLDYVRTTANRYIALKPLVRLLEALEETQPQVGYTF